MYWLMKNRIIVFLFLSCTVSTEAQQIIDSKLAEAIRWTCPGCIDTANKLTTLASTLRNITLTNNISDLTGIQGFTNLVSLNVADNNLTSLPTLPPGLTLFRCSNNKLTQLPNLPTSLTSFHCYGNKLTSLPSLPNNLRVFDCSNNQITTLPALPNTLEDFYCSYNALSSLPNLPPLLTDMGCSNNNLTQLPNLPVNLILLSCFNNPALKCLPKLPDSLQYLEISPPINCLPNAVRGLKVYRYDATVFNSVILPVCTSTCGATNGVNELLASKIRIFPTYTEGVLNIETDQILIDNVLIFSEMGHQVMNTKVLTVDISKLPSGVYFVRLDVQGERVTKKIVKL